MLGAVAESIQRDALLSDCQPPHLLLDSAHHDIDLLHAHLDKGLSRRARCEALNPLPLWSSSRQVSHRDIPGETKDAQKDRIQQQSKIKVVKMLFLVVVLFVLSWLPLYAVFAIMKFGEEAKRRKKRPNVIKMFSELNLFLVFFSRSGLVAGGQLEPDTEEFLTIFTPIAQWLGSANSCINPILYAFNEKYRRGFIAIIQSRKCWGRLR